MHLHSLYFEEEIQKEHKRTPTRIERNTRGFQCTSENFLNYGVGRGQDSDRTLTGLWKDSDRTLAGPWLDVAGLWRDSGRILRGL